MCRKEILYEIKYILSLDSGFIHVQWVYAGVYVDFDIIINLIDALNYQIASGTSSALHREFSYNVKVAVKSSIGRQ